MVKNLQFQKFLDTRWHHCVITHDDTVSNGWLKILIEAAKECYETVETFKYPNPPVPYWKPNMAFQCSAKKMQQAGKPWLWLESDEIPLKKDWLPLLNESYHDAGMPFFGPVVKGMGHANGTSCYPSNAPDILKRTMTEKHGAWDVVMKPEMIHLNYDASETIQIAWSMVNNRLHQYSHGDKPTFVDQESLKMILPTAVLFHRCVDGSLQARLKERMNKP